MTAPHYLPLPDFTTLPSPVYFRYDEFPAGSESLEHRHDWGQLNYTTQGIMRLWVEGKRFLSPPQYAVWIPPGSTHGCYNPSAVTYRSVYIDTTLCESLPRRACTVAISDILKAILVDFAQRGVHEPEQEADRRLAQVMLDQLSRSAQCVPYFLPYTDHPVLSGVLEALRENPADNRTQVQWARQANMTERTLARLCHRELGMPLGEWRQRLRYLLALEALEEEHSVHAIAYDLGYSNPSAFIAMFRRLAGTTPEQYRRQAGCG